MVKICQSRQKMEKENKKEKSGKVIETIKSQERNQKHKNFKLESLTENLRKIMVKNHESLNSGRPSIPEMNIFSDSDSEDEIIGSRKRRHRSSHGLSPPTSRMRIEEVESIPNQQTTQESMQTSAQVPQVNQTANQERQQVHVNSDFIQLQPYSGTTSQNQQQRPPKRCFHCLAEGHNKPNCPKKNEPEHPDARAYRWPIIQASIARRNQQMQDQGNFGNTGGFGSGNAQSSTQQTFATGWGESTTSGWNTGNRPATTANVSSPTIMEEDEN